MKEKQMTTHSVGAPLGLEQNKWDSLDWSVIKAQVKRLQMRIAKATRERRYGKVRTLQWLLTHSHYAKLLAVKQVTTNRGSRTPGVDGETWRTDKQKFEAAASLQRSGYWAKPLRRIYIPKKRKQRRSLGIPTMKDRAMQALYLLGLEPVVEVTSDYSSYGFRPKRSTHDAIRHCYNALALENRATWILEGDIKSCFDKISHEWLINHTVVDSQVLRQWLNAGYIEKQAFNPTKEGTPQGGIISPTLANIALNGLEGAIKGAAGRKEKVNIIRYADDFIVTAISPEVLKRLKSVIEDFLAERGLSLSREKTKITSIYDGFNFLGFNIRKYKNRFLIKPTKASIKRMRQTIRDVSHRCIAKSTINYINQLNPKLRGWANYYRHVSSSQAFATMDHEVFLAIWKWAKRRHPKKTSRWIRRRYFRQRGGRNWVFYTMVRDKKGRTTPKDVVIVNTITYKRHYMVNGRATPYDPAFNEHYEQLEKWNKQKSSGYWAYNIAPEIFQQCGWA